MEPEYIAPDENCSPAPIDRNCVTVQVLPTRIPRIFGPIEPEEYRRLIERQIWTVREREIRRLARDVYAALRLLHRRRTRLESALHTWFPEAEI